MELREYQLAVILALHEKISREKKRQVLALATGAGKTAIAAEMIRDEVQAGGRCLFLVHRIELINQTVKHLESMGLSVDVQQGKNSRFTFGSEVTVATIQTLASRRQYPVGVTLIFIDECHVLYKTHLLVLGAYPKATVIGLTATPMRKDLGIHFHGLTPGPTIRQLTEMGYLAPLRVFCPGSKAMDALLKDVKIKAGEYQTEDLSRKMRTNARIVGDIVSTWKARAGCRKTLGFAVDVAHAEVLAEAFMAEGVDAATVTYLTHPDLRADRIADFRAGRLQILLSVDALSVGFDVPDVECGIMARPTLSEIVFLQQAGRLLRHSEGKKDAILLDHAGNTLRFGMPVDFEPPELGSEEVKVGKKDLKDYKVLLCRFCEAVLPPLVQSCPECGRDIASRRPRVTVIDGELTEHGKQERENITTEEARRWYLMLRHIAISRGKNPNAAYYQVKEKFSFECPKSWMGLKTIPPTMEVLNWELSRRIAYAKKQEKIASQKMREQADNGTSQALSATPCHVVTEAWIKQHATLNGVGWTREKIEAIGGEWPLRVGWIDRLDGKRISLSQRDAFERRPFNPYHHPETEITLEPEQTQHMREMRN